MRILWRILGAMVAVLLTAIVLVWLFVPLNTPWRAFLQQISLLPGVLEPEPMSRSQAEASIRTVPGYGVSLFAENLYDVRGLEPTPNGDVLASIPGDGRVVLLISDQNGDGISDGRRVLLEGLERPYGLELHDGYLYVGETDGIGRVAFDAASGTVRGPYQRIVDGLPREGNHWRNPIRFGPDGALYVTIGSSCNACIEDDVRRGAMLRFSAEGEYLGIYASGLRNSVGFDWAPDGRLYATDNGRDLLGDDFPPCELNEIIEGGFYGWPFANGAKIPDPEFGDNRDAEIAASIAPVHAFRAHNAPIGIVFLRSANHAPAYQGAAIVALHGSWNRTERDGYKVVSLHFAEDGSITERDFLWGFLDGEVVHGRPAEVVEGADGALYVSDDYGGAVYQVRYGLKGSVAVVGPRPVSAGYDPASVDPGERAAALSEGPGLMAAGACLECHVLKARPTDAPVARKVLDDLASRYTLDELTDYLATPNPPMPPYTEASEQRRALALYLLETY